LIFLVCVFFFFFFFSSRRRHTRLQGDWSSDVCSSDLLLLPLVVPGIVAGTAIYVFQIEVELVTEWPLLGSRAGLVFAHIMITIRSEERRVGKECRSRGSADHEKKKKREDGVIRMSMKT